MQAKKGFTLIELLVVIAIIAILAAILFPVFANARDKARQISDLSNIKQIALGIVMYTNDYDDTYPLGSSDDMNWYGGGSDTTSWILGAAPYISGTDVHVFYGPNDTNAGNTPTIKYPWGTPSFGKEISYGVNAFEETATDGTNWFRERVGVFTAGIPVAYSGAQNGSVTKMSEVTQPSATILLADLQSSDLAPIETSTNLSGTGPAGVGIGNPSGLSGISLIGSTEEGTWSTVLPKASSVTSDQWDGRWQLPNPARSVSAAYPSGPNGLVSTPFSSKSLTNFAYTDGHAKAAKPSSTNPDGINGIYAVGGAQDPNDQWIVNR